MRKLLLFFLFLIMVACSKKSYINSENLFPLEIGVNAKWGYINLNGDIVIPPEYSYCSAFYEGVAIVRDFTGFYSILNKNGDKIGIGSNCTLGNFHDGLATIVSKEFVGYININGEIKIRLSNVTISDFSNNFAVIKDTIKKDNEYVIGYYYINLSGNNPFKTVYDEAGSFSDGYASVKYNGQYFIINTNGKTILNPQYDYVGQYNNGLIKIGKKTNDKLKYGFININGDVIIQCKYEECDDFFGGFCAVKINGEYGLIDKNEKWIVQPKYQLMYSPRESIIPFMNDEKWGFMHIDGSLVANQFFDDVTLDFFKNNMALVTMYELRSDGYYPMDGYIRSDGKIFWGKDYY